MIFIELFCGSATISNTFKEKGIRTFAIDNRQRKGICEPDLRADIFKINSLILNKCLEQKYGDLNSVPVIIWASVPCQIWSHAAGNSHFRESLASSTAAKESIKLLNHTIKLIHEMQPVLYFIENPRGHLRYWKPLIDWLVKNDGMIKQTSWGSYGFPTPKPTNIFTNAHDFKLREMAPFGRGAKALQDFNNLTVCERQKVPRTFADELLIYCESKIESMQIKWENLYISIKL
jgi:hypothetical protein